MELKKQTVHEAVELATLIYESENAAIEITQTIVEKANTMRNAFLFLTLLEQNIGRYKRMRCG